MQADVANATKQSADIVKALAPLFTAGFAIQQLTELLGGALSISDPARQKIEPATKKLYIKVVATIVGAVFVYFSHMKVLGALGYDVSGWVDYPLGALIVGGGTEGINSIMKFLGYAKEDKKLSAANQKATATPAAQAEAAKIGAAA